MAKNLTKNQEIFVCEYLIDRNGTRAYRAAYPTVKKDETARVNASRLLTNANVKAAIDKSLEKQKERTQITADWTLKEIYRVASFDPRKMFDENGNLKSIIDMDDDTAACIGGIDVSQSYSGSGEDKDTETIKKFKIWDKNTALGNLAKHFKLLVDRLESSGPNGEPIKTETTHEISPQAAELLTEIANNAKPRS